MTTSSTILGLLATEQATTDSIAEKLQQPGIVIAAFLVDLEESGFVVSASIGNPEKGRKLVSWRITSAGQNHLQQTQQPATTH